MRASSGVFRFLILAILVPLAQTVGATEADLGKPVTLEEVQAGTLLFRSAHPNVFLAAPTLETDALLRVSGLVARVQVRQRFHNPTDDWLEGVYAFPLPEDAAVDRLRMVIGERVIEGEIQERAAAKKAYEQAKSEGKKASLLEQERPNIFTTSVANIGPGEEIDVVIEYQQTVAYEQGEFGLRFPMVIAPRYVPGRPGVGTASGIDPRAVDVAEEGGTGGGDSTGLETACEEEELESLAPAVVAAGAFSGLGWALATDRVPDAPQITPHVVESGGPEVYLQVELDAGLPLAEITSPTHELDVERRDGARSGASPTYLVELSGLQVAADRDFVLAWRPEQGAAPQAALFSDEHDGVSYQLLMVVPPEGDGAAARVPRETIFIIDTSGSMAGSSIIQAKQALLLALDRLAPEDHFNVVRFDSTAERLFPESVPASALYRERAAAFVDGLGARGGTEMLAALRLALEDPGDTRGLRQVIFVTDGSVGNEEELFGYLHQHLGESRLFPVGIGSAPNSYFMRKAAQFGGGTFTYIVRVDEVGRRMSELFAQIESPVLHDIEIFWDDPETETWPRRVPDLYLGEPVLVAARLPSVPSPGTRVKVSGWRGTDFWEQSFEVGAGARETGIDKLWARRKIASLMDELARPGTDREVAKAEVIEVALAHHLVSKYTSLVAIEKTPSAPADVESKTRPVPVNLPAGWSPGHVTARLPSGATPARLYLLLGVVALLIATLVSRRRAPAAAGRVPGRSS